MKFIVRALVASGISLIGFLISQWIKADTATSNAIISGFSVFGGWFAGSINAEWKKS